MEKIKNGTLQALTYLAMASSLMNGGMMLYNRFHSPKPTIQIQNLEIVCENCPAPYKHQKLVLTAKPAEYDSAQNKLRLDYMLAKN